MCRQLSFLSIVGRSARRSDGLAVSVVSIPPPSLTYLPGCSCIWRSSTTFSFCWLTWGRAAAGKLDFHHRIFQNWTLGIMISKNGLSLFTQTNQYHFFFNKRAEFINCHKRFFESFIHVYISVVNNFWLCSLSKHPLTGYTIWLLISRKGPQTIWTLLKKNTKVLII